MIEVYPQTAMVSLFGLSYTLKYKAKRGRSTGDRRQAFAALIAHLEKLTISDPQLWVGTDPRWDELCDSLVAATSSGGLDLIEDELDAYMCTYIGFYYWTHGASRCRVVGDVDTGYIVTPVTPAIGADLDAVVLETPVRRVRKDGVVPRQSTNAVRGAPTPAPQIAPVPAGQCGCGCGGPVRNRYRPGHDSRHKESFVPAA